MIIIDIKDGEALDKALRRYKKKFEKLGILKEVRRRSHYTPPSMARKTERKKAVSKQRYIQRFSDE